MGQKAPPKYQRFFSRLAGQQVTAEAAALPPADVARSSTFASDLTTEDLKAILDDSSSKNRNLFVGFLGVQIYTLVMTLAITDENLLIGRMTMRIPLVDLGLPPVAWFSVVPLLLFILYIDLLHNLHEHLSKLISWRNACGGKLDTIQMQPFFYDFAFAYSGETWIGQLLARFVWLMVYFLPLLTLLVVQIRFGAYQNLLVSTLHFLLVLLGWLSYRKLYYEFEMETISRHAYGRLARARRWVDFPGAQSMMALVVFACLWLLLSNRWDGGFLYNAIYSNILESLLQPSLNSAWRLIFVVTAVIGLCSRRLCHYLLLVSALAFAGMLAWFYSAWRLDTIRVFINNINNSYLSYLLPHLVVKNRLLINVDDDEKRALEILGGLRASMTILGSNNAPEKEITPLSSAEKSPPKNLVAILWWEEGSRQDFSERSLNLADLSGSNMQRADFGKTSMQGANISGTNLQGALLEDAQMQEANLSDTKLQGANLSNARLQKADLDGAQLQGAYIIGAQLQWASLNYANLQGADISDAQLQGANLFMVQLQGASLSRTQFQGAYCTPEPPPGIDVIQTREGKSGDITFCIQRKAFAPLGDAELEMILPLIPSERKQSWRFARSNSVDGLIGAACGTLTREMTQIIKAYWHDGVPASIAKQWFDQGFGCSTRNQHGP